MATVKQEIMKRSLIINVANGVDDNGKTKIKAFTFGNLKAEAKVEDVFEAANALGGLYAEEVQSIVLSEKSELAEEQ